MRLILSPLDAVLGSTSKVRVLRVLSGREKGVNARELARLSGMSRPAVMGAIADLEAVGILKIDEIGKQFVCRLNRSHILVQGILTPMFAAERDATSSFFAGVRAALEPLKPTGVWIFGSAARETMHPGSDVDVFVLARRSPDVDKIEDRLLDHRRAWRQKFGLVVNAIVMTESAAAEQGKAGSPFIRNAVQDARVLLGEIPPALLNRDLHDGSPNRHQTRR